MNTEKARWSLFGSVMAGLLALGQAWAEKASVTPPSPPGPATHSRQAGKSPLKVFVLAGQSNMEGQGIINGAGQGTLETLVKDPASSSRYKHLVDTDGKWVVRDDVWCSYGQKGGLTVGGFAGKGSIGPELGIGWELGNYLDNQVLLIKVAVGGTSLAGPWRPPSSGGNTGYWYLAMIKSVKEQLQNLKTDFPHYDGRGYEIAGFGWHQGWNDGCSAADAMEYETNMVNFIKDVRKDLGMPNLPFVIGGSGFAGWGQKNARRLKIMEAQEAAAAREEFKGNVLYVETRGFWRDRKLSPHGFGYHWNGNAETYYLIGERMGKAMVQLLGGPPAPPNPVNPLPKKEKKASGPKAPVSVVKLPELTLDLGNKVTMKLLKIPSGKFMMGSPEDEEDRGENEGPRREVTIRRPFYMGVYEVTVEQFDQFVKDSGYAWENRTVGYAPRSDHPASRVNWNDAKEFCKWLSKKSGKTVSLPTEAQWEYACRAGTTTRYSFGDDADDLSEYGHYDMDGWDGSAVHSPEVAPVGSFKPNPWGLYDMHGNVNEYCEDYVSSAYSPEDKTDPKGPAEGTRRVMRGGSWRHVAGNGRSAFRGQARPAIGGPREGFRVVVATTE